MMDFFLGLRISKGWISHWGSDANRQAAASNKTITWLLMYNNFLCAHSYPWKCELIWISLAFTGLTAWELPLNSSAWTLWFLLYQVNSSSLQTSGVQSTLACNKYASTFPAMQQTPLLSNTGVHGDWGILNIACCLQNYELFTGLLSKPEITILIQQILVTRGSDELNIIMENSEHIYTISPSSSVFLLV